MARRSDHTREELKNLIILAARDIVATDGFTGLTARRVADYIGYTPGTIYNLFSSMEELALHVNAQTLLRLYDVLAAVPDDKLSPADNMKRMARAYRQFARDERHYWLMLFTHSLSPAAIPPEWYIEAVGRLFTPLEELLRPLYKPADDKSRKLAARALWASVHGMVFLEETGRIPIIAANDGGMDMAAYLIDNFLAGVRAQS